ncbi:hypothetical protein GCM10010302_43320 [Streptomyces polychromogenes]|uniref:Bulb-type lectin domain-containing protein n=1 Tax=Streptomyces polychromogenes TaxID=67342 RepID=A0ABN0VGU5_9ACTN
MIKHFMRRGLPVLALALLPALASVPAADASPAPAAAPAARSDAHFYGGSTLYKNQAWTSGNGRTVLRVQSDGNFVLYKDGRAAWQAPGVWPKANRAVFQEDGNFVVYDANGNAVWAAGTWHKGAYLSVQDDGNAVVYNSANQPVWATNTGD